MEVHDRIKVANLASLEIDVSALYLGFAALCGKTAKMNHDIQSLGIQCAAQATRSVSRSQRVQRQADAGTARAGDREDSSGKP